MLFRSKSLILDRNFSEFKAVIRGRQAFKAWRNQFDADRVAIQASRVSQMDVMRKPYSLLWQYYAHGVHTYKNLKNER